LGFTPHVAAEKLIAGDIDAAFIVTAWDSPVVQHLVALGNVEWTEAALAARRATA
jgi:hypothetical protein